LQTGDKMTDPKVKQPSNVVVEYSQRRAQEWMESAERAEIRNEPATAMLFRQTAWAVENGREWLDTAAIKP